MLKAGVFAQAMARHAIRCGHEVVLSNTGGRLIQLGGPLSALHALLALHALRQD
ncbi:hypothetical protein ABZ682_39375 [Streptomyces griseoviridis]|uniref:hypothetical protein n=1 Tax=Streptomyces griseoviridis TaxID=45398 RepID=UPI0034021DF7